MSLQSPTSESLQGHARARGILLAFIFCALLARLAQGQIVLEPRGTWPGHPRDRARSVYIQGDYAYVGLGGGGFCVIDITDLENPVGLGWNIAAGLTYGGRVVGDYAYVAGGVGLTTIDVSEPTTLVHLSSWTSTSLTSEDVWATNDFVYLADGGAGLQVFSIGNPAAPVRLGGVDSGSASDVWVDGDYAYVAAWADGLQVFCVTNLYDPTLIASTNTDGQGRSVMVDGDYAYLADQEGLKVFCITNPYCPELVGGAYTAGSAHNVFVYENHAYVADLISGLQIFDVSTPTNPVFAGGFSTGTIVGDVWVTEDHAFLAAGDVGLYILCITNPAQPRYVGHYETAGTGTDE